MPLGRRQLQVVMHATMMILTAVEYPVKIPGATGWGHGSVDIPAPRGIYGDMEVQGARRPGPAGRRREA